MKSEFIVNNSFHLGELSEDIVFRNNILKESLKSLPEWWIIGPENFRNAQKNGLHGFPKPFKNPKAKNLSVNYKGNKLNFREFKPESDLKINAIILHIHAGGWVVGSVDIQDEYLSRIANETNSLVLSVDYRLSPENCFPAPLDDCIDAAYWCIENLLNKYVKAKIILMGESAGAHLASLVLINLRDNNLISMVKSAVLSYGIYDLSFTPSALQFGDDRLVLRTIDLYKFRSAFVPTHIDFKNPEISPIYANLKNLCPSFFVVGSCDPLLDDSLFMYSRWLSSSNKALIGVYPGEPHAFTLLNGLKSNDAIEDILRFIKSDL